MLVQLCCGSSVVVLHCYIALLIVHSEMITGQATLFTVHQKQEKIQRIHAPCIRVWGRAERSYFLYCPPKTSEGTANTRSVYLGVGDARREATFFTIHKNKRKYREYTRRVFGFGNARREAFFTVHQKQEKIYTANTRAVYAGAERVGRSYFLLITVHQKQEILKTQRIHMPCIRVRGRAERS